MDSQNTHKMENGYIVDALPDVPDLRDWNFEPSLRKLALKVDPPNNLLILDQQREGACTGFGLAAVVNLLNQQRQSRVRVSPRMLYEMAKRHDKWPGENYAGSSCRGAILGWYHMGVCEEEEWPYRPNRPGNLTAERAKAARNHTLGAYYRVQPRISDFHAAINEAGAIFCSARTHIGWQRPHRSTGLIPFDDTPVGGHAFAIVGYDDKAFWVQNSWGEDWGIQGKPGRRGLARWSYEDWHQNLMDAWVFSLALSTPQIWHLPPSIERNRSQAAKTASPQRSEIAGHFVHVDDGSFHTQGTYWSDAQDVRTTAKHLARHGKDRYRHLLLYAHGGLNSPKASARRIAAMKQTFKDNGVYPYHIMYDTGILEEIKDVILKRAAHATERAGAISDWSDRLLEWTTRVPGRALWREMKSGAAQPFLPTGAGAETLKIFLNEMARKNSTRLTVHVAGHSTGGILMAHLLEAMEDLAPQLRLGSCTLLAPACSVELFRSHYFPYLAQPDTGFGIDKMQVYNLTDELEQEDHVGQVYRKSLLYMVSRAFEEVVEPPTPLLGMQCYSDDLRAEPGVQALGDRFQVIYSPGRSGVLSQSGSHGGFDNDVATMNSLLATILGEAPKTPFTEEALTY